MRSTRRWLTMMAALALSVGAAEAQTTGDVVLRFDRAYDPTGGLDPTDLGFFTDRADFYCRGRVGAGPFLASAPPISNKDDAALNFTVTQSVPRTDRFHAVHLELWDSDDLDPTGDDLADINPATGKKTLDLLFDACTFSWNGDLSGGRRGGLARGAGDGDIADLAFRISTGDDRPFSPDDVAIHDAAPVQVTFEDDYVAVGKPATLRVRLTSSYTVARTGTVSVTVRDGVGGVFTETRPVLVPPEGVTVDFFDGGFGVGPFVPMGTPNGSQLCWDVSANFGVEGPAGGPPPAFVNCYGANNSIVNACRRFAFIDNPKVVYMPYDWSAGGGPVPPSAAEVNDTAAAAESFRLATSPIPFVDSRVSPAPLIDSSVADFGEPFVSMLEAVPLAMASGIDRLVLMPRNGWFADNAASIDFLPSGVIGLSMAEIVPRVVIAEAGYPEVPAHEVGHTYRLSRRSCTNGGFWEEFFDLGCRDEYKHPSPPAPYPASGYDVVGDVYPFGKSPSVGSQREVNATNLMGATSSVVGEYGLWIDGLNYNHLLRDMHVPGGPLPPLLTSGSDVGDPEAAGAAPVAPEPTTAPVATAVSTSGWVQAINGIKADPPVFAAFMLPSFQIDAALSGLDRPEAPLGGTTGAGPFAIRLVTPQGNRTYRFLPAVHPAEIEAPMDGGPYSLALPWDPNTTRVDLFGPTNLYHPGQNQDTLLGSLTRTAASPSLQNVRAGIDTSPTQGGPQPEPPTIPPGHTVGLSWAEIDPDSNDLLRHVLLRPPVNVQAGLLPVALEVPAGEWVMPQAVRNSLPPGAYGLQFLISDGINSTTVDVAHAFDLCDFTNNGIEICDGVDNDCDGVVDDLAPPAGSASVTLQNGLFTWAAMPGAQSYDVVHGNLATLRSTGGDFKSATIGCLANNTAATSIGLQSVPPVGGGFFVLVRPVNCAGPGSYDSGAPSQVAPRDQEIAAAPGACP